VALVVPVDAAALLVVVVVALLVAAVVAGAALRGERAARRLLSSPIVTRVSSSLAAERRICLPLSTWSPASPYTARRGFLSRTPTRAKTLLRRRPSTA
jgi:hypothetical protein